MKILHSLSFLGVAKQGKRSYPPPALALATHFWPGNQALAQATTNVGPEGLGEARRVKAVSIIV